MSLKRSVLTARPREVWTLAALELVGALVCLAAIFAPITMHHFVGPGIVFSVLFAGTAASLWMFSRHLGRFGLLVGALCGVAILSGIVAEARTPQGAVVAAFLYMWTTVYGAWYFTRPHLYFLLCLTAFGAAGGLAAADVPRWPGIWVLLVLTTTMTGAALERAAGQLRRDAETDALTSLLNRRGFFKAAELERSLADRAALNMALILIDLDNFKAVNDAEGHAAGDRLLVEATAAWRAQLRSGDLLARFGGDEFVLLLPDASRPDVDAVIARFHVSHPIAWTSGVAFLQRGEPISECMERADALLYETKLRQRGVGLSR